MREAASGVGPWVVELVGGLQAVKVREGNGTTAYAICDERLEPIYTAARSLDELRGRFRTTRS